MDNLCGRKKVGVWTCGATKVPHWVTEWFPELRDLKYVLPKISGKKIKLMSENQLKLPRCYFIEEIKFNSSPLQTSKLDQLQGETSDQNVRSAIMKVLSYIHVSDKLSAAWYYIDTKLLLYIVQFCFEIFESLKPGVSTTPEQYC